MPAEVVVAHTLVVAEAPAELAVVEVVAALLLEIILATLPQ
jgi:hypothetical protein